MLHFPSPDIGMFGRRQRHVRGHRLPVSIVSDAAEARQDRDTALVIDDFGADETLLPEIGCRCCTVRAKLQTALRRLLTEHGKGKHFSRVAIETSQNLGPILRTFAIGHALGDEFHVQAFPASELGGVDTARQFTLTEDAPLEWDSFCRFIATLTALRGADLLHVKGLLNVNGCRGPLAVQFVQHLAHRPVELQAWPDEDRRSHIEFITRNVEENAVRSMFDAVRSLA